MPWDDWRKHWVLYEREMPDKGQLRQTLWGHNGTYWKNPSQLSRWSISHTGDTDDALVCMERAMQHFIYDVWPNLCDESAEWEIERYGGSQMQSLEIISTMGEAHNTGVTLFTRSLQLEMHHPLLKIRDYCSFQSPSKCICLSAAPVWVRAQAHWHMGSGPTNDQCLW